MEQNNDQEAYILGDLDAWFAIFETGDMAEAYDMQQREYQRILAKYGNGPVSEYDASCE